MTPADCQVAADAFDAAYRALQARRRGLLAMSDGTDRMIPSTENISPTVPGGGHARAIEVTIGNAAEIPVAVSKVARMVATHSIETGRSAFFRLPLDGPLSAVSSVDLLPCRAMLAGLHREQMRIQVVVRA